MPITAASLPAFRQGVGMTRKLGTCVLVGIPPGEFQVFGRWAAREVPSRVVLDFLPS